MIPNVLVICENFTTAIRIVPAYLALRDNGVVNPIFFTTFGEAGTISYLEEHGVEYLTVKDIIDDTDREQLFGLRDEYREIFDTCRAKHAYTTCHYKGVPLLPFIGDEVLRLNQMKIFCNYVFRKLVGRFDPALVFVAYCSGGKKKQYVTMANHMGIPTLHLQYGSTLLPKGTVRRELFSSNYCVWGEAFRDLYVDQPEKRLRTIVTGDPTFDACAHVDSGMVRQRLGLERSNRLIMVGLCFLSECIEAVEQLRGARVSPDDVFVFKLHPALSDQKEEFEQHIKTAGVSYRVVGREMSPYELLHSADHYLALELESLWLAAFHFNVIPTVVTSFLRVSRERQPFPWLFDACACMDTLCSFDQVDQLVANVDRELFEEAKRRLWHRGDFMASQRVAAVVEGLATECPFEQIKEAVEAIR
ncbi:MAG: hypothetical protein JEY79_05720 [Pseudodesulfovibrio sp.]|nr:hypothetical protein [Pseudodesulfovibrio sp.]